jgi:DNA primase
LLRHEARLQADVRVTTLPPGMDPDEVVLRDPQEWARIVEAARPVVVHVMETLAAGQDLDDPKVKSQVAAQVLPLIEDVPNPVERDAYRQRLARLLKVDERSLLGPAAALAGRRLRPGRRSYPGREAGETGPLPSNRSTSGIGANVDPGSVLESYCLKFLIQKPENIHLVNRALQEAGLTRLDLPDFNHTDHQVIFKLIQQSVEQADDDPILYIQKHMDEALADRAQALISAPLPEVSNPERLFEELVQKILLLRRNNVNQNLNQLRFLQEEVQQQGDLRAQVYADLVVQYIQTRDRLDRALGASSKR